MSDKNAKLVYSTSRIIPRKERPVEEGVKPALNPARHKVTVRLDRKQRGGKSVTVIEGLVMPWKDRDALLRRLKSGLGTGGTVREAVLEIQGDHREALIAALTEMGYRPKCSGG